jgi:hypothetical protein
MSKMAGKKANTSKPRTCGCCGKTQNVVNCSCEDELTKGPTHECRIVKHFSDILKLCDEGCLSVSVATFNIGISSSKKMVFSKVNEFVKAKKMCARNQARNGRVPFCRVMAIKCVLEQWETYPDFIILSEAPNNIGEDMKKFLPMYDFR